MQFTDPEGATIHYDHRPASAGAPTLAFANSLGTDLRIWDGVVAALPRSFGVLRFDLRGHGLSDLAPAETVAHHVADLAGVLGDAGVSRVALVGLSIGGVIAQAFALAHPDRVAALVLACTAARIGTRHDWDARIATVRGAGLAALAGPVMERWFSAAFRAGEPRIVAGMTNMLVRQPAAGYAALCTMLRDTDLTADAGSITAPTLVLAGSDDLATPPDLVRATADLIPGAEFARMEGVGHILCVERPQEVAARILGFLAARGIAGQEAAGA